MNIKKLATAMLLTAGLVSTASAHDIQFQALSAANGSSATDIWESSCNSATGVDSFRMAARIEDHIPGRSDTISLVIYKDGIASTTTDLVGGGAKSDWAYVNGGNGAYTFMVHHVTSTGTTNASDVYYSIEFHCEAANLVTHTGTTIPSVAIQDQ